MAVQFQAGAASNQILQEDALRRQQEQQQLADDDKRAADLEDFAAKETIKAKIKNDNDILKAAALAGSPKTQAKLNKQRRDEQHAEFKAQSTRIFRGENVTFVQKDFPDLNLGLNSGSTGFSLQQNPDGTTTYTEHLMDGTTDVDTLSHEEANAAFKTIGIEPVARPLQKKVAKPPKGPTTSKADQEIAVTNEDGTRSFVKAFAVHGPDGKLVGWRSTTGEDIPVDRVESRTRDEIIKKHSFTIDRNVGRLARKVDKITGLELDGRGGKIGRDDISTKDFAEIFDGFSDKLAIALEDKIALDNAAPNDPGVMEVAAAELLSTLLSEHAGETVNGVPLEAYIMDQLFPKKKKE